MKDNRIRSYAVMAAVVVAVIAAIAIAISFWPASPGEEVVAEGNTETPLEGYLPIRPKVIVVPNPTGEQESVTIKGNGFGANKEVNIYLDEDELKTNPATVTTGANGDFTAVADLKGPVEGRHIITARDAQNAAASIGLVVGPAAQS